MLQKLKKELFEFRLLIKSVPTLAVTMFVLSVFSMNLLANKSIALPFSWIALDCGIIFSWFTFFTMDIITKHFGPKAATEISVLAIFINLFICIMFFIGSLIPGVWGESYVEGSETLLNCALDKTFGGTWYVLAGSTAAFLISAIVNNFSNYAIGRCFRKNPDSFAAYIARTYISTALGQFLDNFVFALIVSHFLFGWTLIQCITCALTGMIAELLCEFVFSFLGYRICTKWKREKVGQEYLDYIKA